MKTLAPVRVPPPISEAIEAYCAPRMLTQAQLLRDALIEFFEKRGINLLDKIAAYMEAANG